MEGYKINPDRAFAVLTGASQTTNTMLREIAAGRVSTGTLPGVTETV